MTDLIALPVLTEKGIAAFGDLLASQRAVEKSSDRRVMADAILADPELCQAHPSDLKIDPTMTFENALDVCKYLHGVLEPLGVAGWVDRGINAGLYLVFIDQLVGAKARKPDDYVLGRRASGPTRNYRNSLWVFFTFYVVHLRQEGGLAGRLLENCPPHQIINAMENLAQKPSIVGALGVLDFIGISLLNDKAKFVRPPRKETGGVTIKPAKVLQELSVVLTQCSKNYDVAEMTATQLVSLIPDTNSLSFYKRRAKKAIATRNRPPKMDAAA